MTIYTMTFRGSRLGERLILRAPDDEGGSGGGDDAAAKAAADAAAKAAQDAADAAAAKKAGDEGKQPPAQDPTLLQEVMEKKRLLREAQDKLKAFEGIDPAAVKQLLADQKAAKDREEAAERERLEKAGEFDRLKQMMADQHKVEKEALETRATEAEQRLQESQRRIEDLTVGQDFGLSNYIRESLVLTPAKTRRLYGDHFEQVDGKTVGYDKPKGDPKRTMLVDSSGTPLSFDAALAKIVDGDPDKRTVLKATVTPGSGGQPADRGKPTPDGKPKSEGFRPSNAESLHGVTRIAASLKDL